MRNTVAPLNRGVAKVPFYQRIRLWVFVGRAGVDVFPGKPGPVTRVTVERHRFPNRFELRLAYDEAGRVASTYADQMARVGGVRIVPRAVLEIDGIPTAVQLELQAINPRMLVQVAA